MTRAEMVARLLIESTWNDRYEIALELERLGAIADAAVVLVDAPCVPYSSTCAAGDHDYCERGKAEQQLHRVVAERR